MGNEPVVPVGRSGLKWTPSAGPQMQPLWWFLTEKLLLPLGVRAAVMQVPIKSGSPYKVIAHLCSGK